MTYLATAIRVVKSLLCGLFIVSGTVVSASETITYSYDELGRLIASANNGGPGSGKATVTGFDPAGNRTGHASGVPLPPPVTAASFVVAGPTAPVVEGTPAQFTITKSNPTSGPLSVVITTANGSAVAPADYVAGSAVLTFRNWETVKYFSVTTNADTLSDGGEQFSVTLSAPSPGATITTATAAVSLSDSNQPPVTNPDSVTAEACLSATVNVVANDTDPEGNYPLVVTAVSAGTYGVTSLVGTTSVKYRGSGTSGSETITYTVRDSLGATSTGQLQASVTPGSGCQ